MVNGDMKLLQQLTDRDYNLEKMSSPYHTTLHKNQKFVARPVLLECGKSIQDVIDASWPNCKHMIMCSEMMNDATNDMLDSVLMPETVTITEQTTNQEDVVVDESLFPSNAGVRTKKRKKAVKRAAVSKVVWKDPKLRGVLPDPDEWGSFQTGVDLSNGNTLTSTFNTPRAIIIPNIPAFELEHLDEALDGNPKLVGILGICNMHCDFRAVAMVAEVLEEPIDVKYLGSSAGDVKSAVDDFNGVLSKDIKVRHGIFKTETGKEIRKKTLNGMAARRIREDWSLDEKSDLPSLRRTGAYKSKYASPETQLDAAHTHALLLTSASPLTLTHPSPLLCSRYFRALFKTIALVDPGNVLLTKLPEFIDAIMNFCKAIAITRKMKPSVAQMDSFDENAALFVTKWRILQQSLKGYGFHLWATMSCIFRRVKSMEVINQSAVEGNNERMARHMPSIPKSPAGSYKTSDRELGPERLAEVLTYRRRHLKSVCRSMYEFCSEEMVRTPRTHTSTHALSASTSLSTYLTYLPTYPIVGCQVPLGPQRQAQKGHLVLHHQHPP